MDEIKDTPTDRAAMELLLRSYPETKVDPTRTTVGLLNEVWARMARHLAAMSDADFDGVEARIAELREAASADLETHQARFSKSTFPDREARLAGAERAAELLGLIVEWRGETFEAAEVAAGRDSYATEAVWTPPPGWTPPARR